jgi:hypothetical protein
MQKRPRLLQEPAFVPKFVLELGDPDRVVELGSLGRAQLHETRT